MILLTTSSIQGQKKHKIFVEDGLYGIRNSTGAIILQPKFDFIVNVQPLYVKDYPDLFKVRKGTEHSLYEVGSGIVTSKTYKGMEPMRNGSMVAHDDDNYYLLGEDGKNLCDQSYDLIYDLSRKNNNSYVAVCDRKCGLVDRSCNPVIDLKYDYIFDIEKDLFYFKENDLCGVVNNSGDVLVEARYSKIRSYNDSVFVATKGAFQVFVNRQGKEFFDSKYTHLMTSGKDLIVVTTKEKKFGYINWNGDIIIEPKYDHATGFKNDRARVVLNKKYGIINKDGDYILDPRFDKIKFTALGYDVQLANEWIQIDLDGNCLSNCDAIKD